MSQQRKKSEIAHRVNDYAVQSETRAVGENYVTMHNALVRAAHGLSLIEKRLVAAGISKLDSRRRAVGVVRTKLTAAEYAETFGVDARHAYEDLRDAARHLQQRVIVFYEPPPSRRWKPTQVRMSWVATSRYQDGEGWVELSWNPELLPFLTDLRERFTTYQLQQAAALRSGYSWKLLELLSQYKSTGQLEIEIAEFAHVMEATEKQRQDFGKIRTKIIEPAVRELREKDNWLIEWEPVKRGRTVAALRFRFARNPQQRLF